MVPMCSYPPHWPCHQRRLANCDWMPAPYSKGQPSYSRRHPTRWASSQRSYTFSNMPCHRAWTPASLSAHLPTGCECTASQIDTPVCARRATTDQFIWQQQHTCGALGGSPMEHGVVGQPYETPYFHLRRRHSSSLEQRGSDFTASAPVSGVSAPACTNGVWSPLRPVSVAQNYKPSTTLSFSVQSINLLMECTPHGLAVLDAETIEWLLNTCPDI